VLKILHTLFFLLLVSAVTCAQDKSNRGKEFWLGYGYNYKFVYDAPLNDQELALYVSTTDSANVTISVNGTTWTKTLHIPANSVDATTLIPKSGADDARILSDGFSNKGIHIISDVPVAVYAHCYGPMVSGATMLLPVETYGFSYYSINYYQTKSQSNVPEWYSWFYVLASENNTKVLITPSDTTKNGWLPNQTYTVTLNKGEMYNVFGKAGPFNTNIYDLCSKDMTGSKVVSTVGADGVCHPIAVFSGSSGIRLCRGDGGEFMHQQVFPSQAWGTRYLTYHTINNTTTDINETNRNIYRICVSDPSTVVKKNGVALSGLINNFFYEYMDSTGGDYIESDRPVLVSQYTVNKNQCWNYPTSTPSPPSYGDPEMFYLSPIEQGQNSVIFYVSRKSTIDYVYANIYLPTSAIASLKVDGNTLPASQIIPHPKNSYYSVGLARFIGPAASHRITCDSNFNASVYGLGNYESYGYNVGTKINNLNYYTQISNTQSTSTVDTFSCPKTPFRLYLKIGFPATFINWKLSQLPGISPNIDSNVNNPIPIRTEYINGRIYYVYTLQQDFIINTIGTFSLPVTYGAAVLQNCSQSENAVINIVIKPGPIADFSIAASGNNCIKDSLQLSGIVSAAGFLINQYLWNFPDGTTANAINTAKKFTTTGPQAIRFRIYADNGCAADTTKTITIQSGAIADFNIASASCEKDSILVTDNSSVATGNITAWQWIYQNAVVTKTNGNSFKILFSSNGTYPISLLVTGSNGCKSDTATKTITINPKPVAKFGYAGNICIADSIKYSDSSSIASGTITKWNWNFGNGQTSIRNNNGVFYWPYSVTGSFTTSLITESNNGCKSDTASKLITVNNKPVASIQINGTACVDSTFSFTSSIATGPATWYWNFGNGQSSTSASSSSAQQVYTSAANGVSIKHVVSYGPGCVSDTATSTIASIYSNPTANIILQTDTLCAGTPILFSGNSAAANISWNWIIDGTLTRQTPPFTHTFTQPKSYNIVSFVTNAGGCNSVPFSQVLNIRPKPDLNAGPDLVINPGNSITLSASLSQSSNYYITWLPGSTLNDSTTLNPLASPANPTLYTIRVTDKSANCTAIDQVFLNVVSKLAVPNAFSPNGDGINDQWLLAGIELYPKATVSIYTRYGQRIFEKQNYHQHPWDGTSNQKLLPVGSYAYIIQLNNAAKEVLAGTVLLLR
jgi:gliding motility-associated-like protein